MSFYRIRKVRLVNFHNFADETIEVRSGGHLFMLGDNGSGKTTVLDAIHFALTGGRSMEFNAAARVAGARGSGGRTVQGIVMRYNLEANGPLNKSGGVSYVALEIEGHHGRAVAIAVGVSTTSMEERYESWGVIREGGVAELPLLQEEQGRRRVTTRSELRAALDGTGYYGRIGTYCEELARRFFSDRETYDDVCKFLATGKAYREIVSKTGDYHLLFRELLQEPPREVFEEVIRNLKSLEESRLELDKLRRQEKFVANLSGLVRKITEGRIDRAAAEWQRRSLAAAESRRLYEEHSVMLAAEKQRLSDLDEQQLSLDNQRERQELYLSNLRHSDPGGVVALEQEARNRVARARQQHELAKRRLKETRKGADEAQRVVVARRKELVQELVRLARELQRLGRMMPFTTSALTAELEYSAKSERPEEELKLASVWELRNESDKTLREVERNIERSEADCAKISADLQRLEGEIEEVRKRGEALPRVKGFAEAEREIRGQMLNALPLYLGLEPTSGMTARDLAALEQLIGDKALATWVVEEESADRLRGLLFRHHPEQSLAVVSSATRPVEGQYSEWLRRYFDFNKSDANALLVLQHQLAAREGPHATRSFEQRVATFRLREEVVVAEQPRLIGAEARRREAEREMRRLEGQRIELERELEEQKRDLAKSGEVRERLTAFMQLLRETEAVAEVGRLVTGAVSTLQTAGKSVEESQRVCMESEEEYVIAHDHHVGLQEALKQSGIEGLQRKQREAELKLAGLKREFEKCISETALLRKRIDELTELCSVQLHDETEELAAREVAQSELQTLVEYEGDIGVFAAQRCGAAADSRVELEKFTHERHDQEMRIAGELYTLIVQSAALVFGFIYDEAANNLSDRRGRSVVEVLEGCSRALQEQEELINEETIKLFRQLVMDNLVSKLQLSVRRLREMSRRINRLLGERSFGNNSYTFSITVLDEYRRIEELVLKYHSLDRSETEAELRAFIEDHAEEIKATEVNEIPPILDYRNWFRYDLKVTTLQSDGVVMDRRVKSIGSGGEQAVPNYLLILTIAHFLYDKEKVRLPILIFDEAFYGIDAGRRDQLLGFASDLELQLFVASPDQDGVNKEIPYSTSILVVKDTAFDVHLYPYYWSSMPQQMDLLSNEEPQKLGFGEAL